jgi:hypothetical protein
MSAQLVPIAITELPDLASPSKPAKLHIVPPVPTSPKESGPNNSQPKQSRHARRCTVCHHTDRLEIEDDFLHWRPSTEIAAEYGLPDRRAVYRHARATGLYRRRMKNMRVACSYIAEHAERVTPNAKNVLDAIRACSLIDANGVWHEQPRRTIVEYVNAPQPPPESVAAAPAASAATSPKTETSNVHSMKSESVATATKQTAAHPSNVYSAAIPPKPPSSDPLHGLDLAFVAVGRSTKIDPAALELAR